MQVATLMHLHQGMMLARRGLNDDISESKLGRTRKAKGLTCWVGQSRSLPRNYHFHVSHEEFKVGARCPFAIFRAVARHTLCGSQTAPLALVAGAQHGTQERSKACKAIRSS